jgi:beta-lactamase class A
MRSRQTIPALEIAGLVLIIMATIVFVGQMGNFSQSRQQMPTSLELGGVPVGGLNRVEAQAILEQVYGAPVSVVYRDQDIRLDPRQVNFVVNSQAMLARADELRTEGGTFWSGFWDYIWRRPEQTYTVELDASYSRELLEAWLQDVAMRYDSPPTDPVANLDTLSFEPGEPGYTLDVEASMALLDDALLRPTNRTVSLVLDEKEQGDATLDGLETLLVDYITASGFSGVVSVVVIDLETGDEIDLNVDTRGGPPQMVTCDIAYAGMSTMKIPIMMDFMRFLDGTPSPESNDYEILYNTMTASGNISANFMMQRTGRESLDRGMERVNNLLGFLGLDNTFIAVPYEVEEDPEYYSTPAREAARSGACVNTQPDPSMQTTTSDLAHMLDMIYQCAEFNGGALRAAYPEAITQDECGMMLDAMADNEEGVLIMAGLPTDVDVAHKHGWIADTHGDAGVVFSPGGDYALVTMVWANTDWLNFQDSFPVIADISAAAFNYFNPALVDEPRRGLSPVETGDSPPPPSTDDTEEGEQ